MRERILLDLRYALRALRRQPAFSAVAITVLAVGIGLNSAAFGLIDALLLRPLPVADPEALVRISATGTDGGISYPDLVSYRASVPSLSGVAAFTADVLAVRVEGEDAVDRAGAYLVTEGYFELLGVAPRLGSAPSRGRNGQAPGVLLSDRYWRRRFGGDPAVLGRGLWLNAAAFVVAGVAPPEFGGTMRGGAPEMYVPYEALAGSDTLEGRGRRGLIGLGRLAPGASVDAAQSELAVVGRRLAATFPETNRGVSPRLGPERTAIFREAPPLAAVVAAALGLFVLLLLVACVNVAGLLTARAAVRQREIVIRAMQGASRSALAAQLLTESLVLAVLGGAFGLGLGVLFRNLLWLRLQSSVAEHLGLDVLGIDTGLDGRVLLFTLAVSLGSVFAFGLLPALHASSGDLYGRAHGTVSTPPPSTLAHLRRLVAAQIAVSAVLVACAGLLLQTVRNAASLDLGYPTDRALVTDLDLSGVDPADRRRALDAAAHEAEGWPGIEAAAVTIGSWPDYLPAAATPGRPRQNYVLTYCGPGFFRTARIPVFAGREFDARDAEAPRVAIVNQRLADALWPDGRALGRLLPVRDGAPPLTVVGVVKSVRSFPIGPPFFQLYLPISSGEHDKAVLHARVAPGQEAAIRGRLVQDLRRTPSGLSAVRVRALDEWAGSILAVPRAAVGVFATLGAGALALAALGLYGLMAYAAGRRARELAVRQVLGATRASIGWLLLRQSLRPILIGLAAGTAVSIGAGLVLKAVLLGAAFDAVVLALAPSVLAATACAAVAWPAYRGATADPMNLLRDE